MFAKVFKQIFNSSIAEDYTIRHVFMDLLVLADKDGVVDMTTEAIARVTNVPFEMVSNALTKLSLPDERSRAHHEDGKRIVLIDSHRNWGWQIVNYSHYRNIVDEESRKAYFRDKQREYRSNKSKLSNNVKDNSNSQSLSKKITEAEAEAEAEVKANAKDNTRARVLDRYTTVTDPYKGVQSPFVQPSARTEVDIAALRAIGFRRSHAASVEHEYAQVLEAGADPKEVIRACQRIYEWTEKGKYARDLADTIKRWQEPQHLWIRADENGKRRKTDAEIIRESRTDPDA